MNLSIVVALVSSLSGQQEVSTVGKVCGGLMPTEVSSCFAAVGGKYVDPDAAAMCGRQMIQEVIPCLRAVAGKDYTPDDLAACRRSMGSSYVGCLEKAGTLHGPNCAPFTTDIAELNAALERLQGEDRRVAGALVAATLDAVRRLAE